MSEIRRTPSFLLPDSEKIRRLESERDQIKGALLTYYGQLVEGGRSGHIITINEFSQVLKDARLVTQLTKSGFAHFMKRNLGHADLNKLLNELKLPHGKIRSWTSDY